MRPQDPSHHLVTVVISFWGSCWMLHDALSSRGVYTRNSVVPLVNEANLIA